ncbi:uncharacterized protein [Dermacentor albipictus]|uniref:uncharacterized protein n=1 Tax=Dermacentor albipictus TaxID=60249 RepID=UPI0038FCD288
MSPIMPAFSYFSLHQTAFTAYLGSERAETASILLSREQNLIVIHTPDLETADRVIGDFSVNTERGAVPLHGYLRQDGGNVCHGVIVVCNSDTKETLQQKVRWRAGAIVEVRKFGTSNKACVTFAGKDKPRFVHYDNMVVPVQPYYRTIPACGKCGAIGHRMDACPNLRQDTCGMCGQQIPLVEGVRAPHECVPKCSVCGGGHVTNSRECTAKFLNSKIAAQKGGKTITAVKKKHRHLDLPGGPPHRDVTKTGKPAPPAGEAGRQTTAPPHGVAGAWADAVKKGKQEQGYRVWSQQLVSTLRSTETQIQLSEATPEVDNHLLHLWEARHSLVRRWRRQKHNRKLKIRIAELTQRAAEYAALLADSNWVDRCNTAARQMSSRSTRRLFRALIDSTKTRAERQKHLQRAIHCFDGDTSKLACKLRDQYLCTQQDPRGPA